MQVIVVFEYADVLHVDGPEADKIIEDITESCETMRVGLNASACWVDNAKGEPRPKAVEYDQRHGGPYDRGSADAYYRREYDPHYFKGDTHNSERVSGADMTAADVIAYTVGFTEQRASGEFKDWGSPFAHASRDMGEEFDRPADN
jgi:hypothetical protein